MPLPLNSHTLIQLTPLLQTIPINMNRLLIHSQRQLGTLLLPTEHLNRNLLPVQPKLPISPPPITKRIKHGLIHLHHPSRMLRFQPRRGIFRVSSSEGPHHDGDAFRRVVKEVSAGVVEGVIVSVDGVDADQGADEGGADGGEVRGYKLA